MDTIKSRKAMRREGINRNGVRFVLINEKTKEYMFSCYFGDGLELTKAIKITSNRNLNKVQALNLL